MPWANPPDCKCKDGKPKVYGKGSRSEGYLCPEQINQRTYSKLKNSYYSRISVRELKIILTYKKLSPKGTKRILFDRYSIVSCVTR